MIDIKKIEDEAKLTIVNEVNEKAKVALVAAYRKLSSAEQVVANTRREIEDLKASIADGSFR